MKKAWVVSVDMGYGHARAAYCFADIANERIITANSDKIISPLEVARWKRLQHLYDLASKLEQVPIIGRLIFGVMMYLQSIPPLHPYRNLSGMTIPAWLVHQEINNGLGKSVVVYTKKKELPFLTSFFLTALVASRERVKDVNCIVTDTDVSRVWVCDKPSTNKVMYFVPTEHTAKRLELYGVENKYIYETGFPLPKELVGKTDAIARKNFKRRLRLLDQKKQFSDMYAGQPKETRPLTVMYAIGGAGAHTRIAFDLLGSLKPLFLQKKVHLILCTGTHIELAQSFSQYCEKHHLEESVTIQNSLSKTEYFTEFNRLLAKADVLWTKPSELTFYCALGLPIISSPPLGVHERYNLQWAMQLGSGLMMEDPVNAHEWLMEWWQRGLLAKAAVDGFRLAKRHGTYLIEDLLTKKQ